MIDTQIFSSPILLASNSIAILSNPFSAESFCQLANDFSTLDFKPVRVVEEDVPNSGLGVCMNVVDFGYYNVSAWLRSQLPLSWEKLFKQAASASYKKKLGSLMHTDLSECLTRLEMASYPKGGYLAAHYDREPKKVLTQLFYLNAHWDVEWGGDFCILSPDNTHHVVATVPPVYIYSVVVLADEKAWHAVSPVLGPNTRKIAAIEYYLD